MKTIELNGKKYQEVCETGEAMRIMVVDNRGLTFVGRCDIEGDGQWITIRDARCVIYWGTDAHLAQLADGPREKTRLGHAADVTVRRDSVVAVYDCGCGWNK